MFALGFLVGSFFGAFVAGVALLLLAEFAYQKPRRAGYIDTTRRKP